MGSHGKRFLNMMLLFVLGVSVLAVVTAYSPEEWTKILKQTEEWFSHESRIFDRIWLSLSLLKAFWMNDSVVYTAGSTDYRTESNMVKYTILKLFIAILFLISLNFSTFASVFWKSRFTAALVRKWSLSSGYWLLIRLVTDILLKETVISFLMAVMRLWRLVMNTSTSSLPGTEGRSRYEED